MKKEIATLEDIQLMVNSFYGKVKDDDLIGHIFNDKIQDRWQIHLEKMYRFWQTVLLKQHTYEGSPFPPHASLAIDKSHFDRWMQLFTTTIDEHFEGEKAEEAKWRAGKMAELFQYKIQSYKNGFGKPLV